MEKSIGGRGIDTESRNSSRAWLQGKETILALVLASQSLHMDNGHPQSLPSPDSVAFPVAHHSDISTCYSEKVALLST